MSAKYEKHKIPTIFPFITLETRISRFDLSRKYSLFSHILKIYSEATRVRKREDIDLMYLVLQMRVFCGYVVAEIIEEP